MAQYDAWYNNNSFDIVCYDISPQNKGKCQVVPGKGKIEPQHTHCVICRILGP